MVKYCPKCGEKTSDAANVCSKCGHSFKKKGFDKRNIIIVVLIILIAIVSCFIAYSVIYAEDTKTVDIGVATFNCSEDLNFTLSEMDEDGFKSYADQSGRYTVKVWDNSQFNVFYDYGLTLAEEQIKNSPSSVVDNVLVYNTTANQGEYIGEPRFLTIIDNLDKNFKVHIISPELEDTVEMAKSFQFK